MRLIIEIILWFLLWPITFGVSYYLIFKRGITYTKGYSWMTLYWVFASLIAILIFKNTLYPLIESFTPIPFIVLIATYIVSHLSYYYVNKKVSRPRELLKNHPHEFVISLKHRYLISKLPSILFQQTLIATFSLTLINNSFSISQIIIILVIIFVLFHIHLIKKNGIFFGLFYVLSALFGSILFPLLILKINYGFVYSFSLHLAFYTIMGTGFWIYEHKKKLIITSSN